MSDTEPGVNPGEGYSLDIQHELRVVASNLAREYEGVFNVETIQRFVNDSFEALGGARIKSFVPVIAERFARQRLRALAKVDHGSGSKIPHVLFLCVHNAGRSQMAAGWLRHLAGDGVAVYSGGSEPTDRINPAAIEAMREVDIDITHEFPKPWTDEVVQAADIVVTMGCGDACPVYPGVRYVDWEVPDPAGQSVDAVRPIRDELRERVEGLMETLGVPAASASAN